MPRGTSLKRRFVSKRERGQLASVSLAAVGVVHSRPGESNRVMGYNDTHSSIAGIPPVALFLGLGEARWATPLVTALGSVQQLLE
jgi:hypothetical protein